MFELISQEIKEKVEDRYSRMASAFLSIALDFDEPDEDEFLENTKEKDLSTGALAKEDVSAPVFSIDTGKV